MTFGQRLKEVRKVRGLSGRDLAALLNTTAAAVSLYETDASHPKAQTLMLLFEVLDVEPNYLYQDSFGWDVELSTNKRAIPERQEATIQKYLDLADKSAVDVLVDGLHKRENP